MRLDQRTNLANRSTPERILDHARKAFNERGVGAVGIREIARDLQLSPGNVSYHFPTKAALIAALIERTHTANNAAAAAPVGPLDFHQLDAILRAIMRRDVENQWLMRDAVGLVFSLPELRALHNRMQKSREARADGLIERLLDAGMLDRGRTEPARRYLRVQLLTQVFFWLPAAIMAAPTADPSKRLDLHARAAMALFVAYCTPAGKRQLSSLLDGTEQPS
jgi:AcrR family transcriptional regulator